MTHLWLMQAVKEELKKNNGAFVISASVAGLRPGGSSMVSVNFGRLRLQRRTEGHGSAAETYTPLWTAACRLMSTSAVKQHYR